jgi:hypothetical protein
LAHSMAFSDCSSLGPICNKRTSASSFSPFRRQRSTSQRVSEKAKPFSLRYYRIRLSERRRLRRKLKYPWRPEPETNRQ